MNNLLFYKEYKILTNSFFLINKILMLLKIKNKFNFIKLITIRNFFLTKLN